MGRVGETVRRTFQLASKMRDERGADGPDDNERVLRYLAKCTINAALAHGLAHEIGALTPGRLADVVLWRPEWFGVKPALVLKSGFPAWGPTGDPNAVVDYLRAAGARPAVRRPRRRAGRALRRASSPAPSLDGGGAAAAADAQAPLGRRRHPRGSAPRDMVRNDRLGAVRVDPATHEVTLDGEPVRSEPAATVPLSALYLLG